MYTFALLMMSIGISIGMHAAETPILFDYLTIEDGLSHNSVRCIMKDYKGFMWFGTFDGLNRYDGYKFVVYRHDKNNTDTLGGSYITALLEDKKGNLWIGTRTGGLNLYNREKDRFIRFQRQKSQPNSLSHNYVTALCEDLQGRIWIATYGGGLNCFDYQHQRLKHFKYDPRKSDSLSSNEVISLYIDNENNLWAGTDGNVFNLYDETNNQFRRYHCPAPENCSIKVISQDKEGFLWVGSDGNGLYRFHKNSQTYFHYHHQPGGKSISNNAIMDIHQAKDGSIWIATEGGGLNIYQEKSTEGNDDFEIKSVETFRHIVPDDTAPNSLSSYSIYTIYEDDQGILWIGTQQSGVNILDKNKHKFKTVRHNIKDPTSLSGNRVSCFLRDKDGNTWIGADGGGLNRMRRDGKTFDHFRHNPNDPTSLSGDDVKKMIEDRDGYLWIVTYAHGLNRMDRKTGKCRRFIYRPHETEGLSSEFLRTVYQDRKGNLWIGTADRGLDRLDLETGRFIHHRHDSGNPHSLSCDQVFTLLEDRDGLFWVGTLGGGLNLFDRKRQTFTHYHHREDDRSQRTTNTFGDKNSSISSDFIRCLFEDSQGNLWVGTDQGGFNLFNRKDGTFTCYKQKTDDGLPDNAVHAILEDDLGHLWLSTSRGLSRFEPHTGIFRNFDVADGLQGNQFIDGSCFKSPQGKLYFGGTKGFNAFIPEDIQDNPHVGPVVFTGFQIFNQPVPIGPMDDGRTILTKSITETREIELSYGDRVFSIEFAALNYTNSHKNKYAYMMEGLDKDWNVIKYRPFVMYTTLPPGNYTFKVRGSNNDRVWNLREATLKIIVTPPLVRTFWFHLFIAISLLTTIYILYRLRIRSITMRRKNLENTVKTRTRELSIKKEELEKINFIVKAINQKLDLVKLMKTILKEIRVIEGIENATALIYNKDEDAYEFKATQGWNNNLLDPIFLP